MTSECIQSLRHLHLISESTAKKKHQSSTVIVHQQTNNAGALRAGHCISPLLPEMSPTCPQSDPLRGSWKQSER